MSTLQTFKDRLAVVEGQLAKHNSAVEQAGRGDKYVKFKGSAELYQELTWLTNKIGKLSGTVHNKVYMQNGGRGYV